MRKVLVISFILVAAVFVSKVHASPAPATLSVNANAWAKVKNGNYVQARNNAINNAFISAVSKTVSSILSGNKNGENDGQIPEVVERGKDFVFSYKVLKESTKNGNVFVNLQVTIFADQLRKAIKSAGVNVRRRGLPTVVTLIDERTVRFITSNNLLLLNSLSEEIVVKALRDRGYQVVDRKDVRQRGLGKDGVGALNGDLTAILRLTNAFDADLLIIGNTNVSAKAAIGGEAMKAQTSIMLLDSSGKTLGNFSGAKEGLYDDALAGSIATIRGASQKVAQEISVMTPSLWKSR